MPLSLLGYPITGCTGLTNLCDKVTNHKCCEAKQHEDAPDVKVRSKAWTRPESWIFQSPSLWANKTVFEFPTSSVVALCDPPLTALVMPWPPIYSTRLCIGANGAGGCILECCTFFSLAPAVLYKGCDVCSGNGPCTMEGLDKFDDAADSRTP